MLALVTYVIRAFGGTLIFGGPLTQRPTVLVVANFRSGSVSPTSFRDGDVSATFRDGDATGVSR